MLSSTFCVYFSKRNFFYTAVVYFFKKVIDIIRFL